MLVAASYFGLSLKQAVLATIVGGLIGNAMLAAAALIGADARVPTMVLQRAPLGQRGSYLATGLNVLQCLGWAVFELIVIATAAAPSPNRLFGFQAQWSWTLVFGAVALVLGLLGPVGVVRRFVRQSRGLGRPLVDRLPRLVDAAARRAPRDALAPAGHRVASRSGRGGHRRRDHRLVDPARRRLHALLARRAQRLLGRGHRLSRAGRMAPGARSVIVLSRNLCDPAGAARAAVAAGGRRTRWRSFALTVDETDEAFANIYSTAVSLQNVAPARAAATARRRDDG